MKYIVAKIHNNRLGCVHEYDNLDDANAKVMELFELQFGRGINEEESTELDEMYEIYNDEDHDNHYTFSIGIIDY